MSRGGFTGAVQARKGLLTEADGGTLLLDEIGDMSFGLQAKLLRVLQFGDIRPVGSDRVHHVDVRVIASTHRDLPALVKEGRFREDLYFRLNVLSVPRPAPARSARRHPGAGGALPGAGVPARARVPGPLHRAGRARALTERSWPGNVRELASSIERAVVFGVDEMIDVNQLSPSPTSARVRVAVPERVSLDPAAPESHVRRLGARADRRRQAARGRDPRHRPFDALPVATQATGLSGSRRPRFKRPHSDLCLFARPPASR